MAETIGTREHRGHRSDRADPHDGGPGHGSARRRNGRGPRRRPVALSVAHLTTRKLQDVSFELHHGEVLGIAGLVGAGRSELGAALFGLDPFMMAAFCN